MSKIEAEAGGSPDIGVQNWLKRPESEKHAADIVWQDQEFGRIMENVWPAGFPQTETQFGNPGLEEGEPLLFELPEVLVCQTEDDYARHECIAWQRYEGVVARFWPEYLRISESAWNRHCSIEQAVWRLYEETVEPARLKLKEDIISAQTRKDKAAVFAAKSEYAQVTQPARQWRMETLQTACEEYEQIVRSARLEYDWIESSAREAYDATLKQLGQSLKEHSSEDNRFGSEEAA